MELVEGFTLEERLAQGPLAIPDALRIARQLAEALETAHDLGIIHRDLKPANIKLMMRGISCCGRMTAALIVGSRRSMSTIAREGTGLRAGQGARPGGRRRVATRSTRQRSRRARPSSA